MLVSQMTSYEISFKLAEVYGDDSQPLTNETVAVIRLADAYAAFGESLEFEAVESAIRRHECRLYGSSGEIMIGEMEGRIGFEVLDLEDREWVTREFGIESPQMKVWRGDEKKYI
jgi:hypothetical protein